MEFLNEVKSYNSAETINCYDKNANQAHVWESPEVELCKSVVLEQTATPVEDNRNNNSTSLIVTLGVDETLSEDIRNNSSTSVIPPLGVVESVPVGNYDKILINEDTSLLLNTRPPTNIDGEFKGVDRRRNKIKHFFLSGISEDVNENQIISYLNKRNNYLLVSPFSKVDEREVTQQRSVYHHLLPQCWKMKIFGRNLSNANRGGKTRRSTKLTYKLDSRENYKP